MKNKLRFLDFSNTKEKCKEEDVAFNVDYLIKELLDFGKSQKQDFKSGKDKKPKSTNLNDENIVPNDIYVPDEYKDVSLVKKNSNSSLKSIPSTVDLESSSKLPRKERKMVSCLFKILGIMILYGDFDIFVSWFSFKLTKLILNAAHDS